MILQSGGLVIQVSRRGTPDTPEVFVEGGYVDLVHREGSCSFVTRWRKDEFATHLEWCVQQHVDQWRAHETARQKPGGEVSV